MTEPQLALATDPNRLSCVFCDEAPMFREPRARSLAAPRPALLCLNCARLFADHRWDELALRWLEHRPQDWASDVSAFMEVSTT